MRDSKPLSASRPTPSIWRALGPALVLALASRAAASGAELLPALAPEPAAAAVPAPVLPGTWQLAGFDPLLPNTDLEPLRKLVGKAQLVGLGESDTTSGGFYQVKHRLVRFLVERLGFRLIAIDSPWVAAERTAAFVERCEGSADEALGFLYPTLASTEMRELLQWMCDWNQAHPKAKDKIRFTGLDVHGQTAADAAALTAFLLRLGWAEDDPRIVGLSECDGVVTQDPNGQIPPARYAACIGSLDAISQFFTANAKAIIRQTSKVDLEWAKLRLVGLRSEEDQHYIGSGGAAWTARNYSLAYNAVKLRELRYPKLKMVILAQNSHLSKEGNAGPPWDFASMGSLLRASQGTKYLPIALAADEVYMDFRNVHCGLVPGHGQPGSYEQTLRDLGLGDLLVDLRARGVVPQVLPAGEHALGAGSIDIRRQFDALVYLDASPGMHPLAWPPCP